MNTPDGYQEINALFGNPANPGGSENNALVRAQIQLVSGHRVRCTCNSIPAPVIARKQKAG